jgi:hypothetical protein
MVLNFNKKKKKKKKKNKNKKKVTSLFVNAFWIVF